MTLAETINLIRSQSRRIGRPGVLPTDIQLVLNRLADDLEHRGIDDLAPRVSGAKVN